ncbi:helix-turn-helix domain-containing protein [Streptomyces sp. ASQP_92]|uniref:helix-turn-helix domain-containing protein n=1 Tax=unclassified Streptomyces TaxID=2593676 RepID=UPI0021BF9081|nr:helix-turn-helix transcriptional regulator [Streptomyces sp. ASQP_92]MCT9089957.1 helix-turn-helix domain-containing protein [Streptomyces sp. ASQP_92]
MLEQPLFGRRLRQLRQQQGKAQTELAGPGMSAAYLSRLESGHRPPTKRAVAYLAERLQVPIEAFGVNKPASLVDVLATAQVSTGADHDLRQQLAAALDAALNVDPGLRWQAHARLATLGAAEGDREAEQSHVEALVAVSDELGHAALQVHSRLRLARSLRGRGELVEARATAREGLELGHRAALTSPDVTRCKLLLASATAELGDLAEAARLSEEICAELRGRRGPLAAEALWTAATLASRKGMTDRSSTLMGEAIDALDSREDLLLWMRLRLAAAALALRGGPPDLLRAERYLTQVRPALDLVGSPLHEQEYAFLRAQLAYGKGHFDDAAALCEAAWEGRDHLTFRDRVRLEMLNEQIRSKQSGTWDQARLAELATEAQERGILDLAAEIWRALAEIRP